MAETSADRIARVRAELTRKLDAWEVAFTPWQSRYGAVEGAWYGPLVSNDYHSTDGLLRWLREVVATGRHPRTGQDLTAVTASWVAYVDSQLKRAADLIGGYIGSSWRAVSSISPDGNSVSWTYIVSQPSVTEREISFQTGLATEFGGAWPVRRADQLREIGFKIQAAQGSISAWQGALDANYPNLDRETLTRAVARESARVERLSYWRDAITADKLPGEDLPEAILSGTVASASPAQEAQAQVVARGIDDARLVEVYETRQRAISAYAAPDPLLVNDGAAAGSVKAASFAVDPTATLGGSDPVEDSPLNRAVPVPGTVYATEDPQWEPGFEGPTGNRPPAAGPTGSPVGGNSGSTTPVPAGAGSPGKTVAAGVVVLVVLVAVLMGA